MNSYTPSNASKVVCVGRNYAEHARELNNPIPSEPVLFIKPNTSICPFAGDIQIPKQYGEVHHELEIALVIGKQLTHATHEQALNAISGIGLALDLTLRDIQTQLKEKQHSWEKAKCFDNACPIECIPFEATESDINELSLRLLINGKTRQQGNTDQMLFKPLELIVYISQWFTLLPGDIVLTGTPAGVNSLQVNDELESTLHINDKECLKIVSKII